MTSGSTKTHIGKEDIKIQTNTGVAESFQRRTTTGGEITITKFPDIWDGTGKVNVAEICLKGLISDPDTTGWGTSEEGKIWFNTTDKKIKMWNGSEIVLLG